MDGLPSVKHCASYHHVTSRLNLIPYIWTHDRMHVVDKKMTSLHAHLTPNPNVKHPVLRYSDLDAMETHTTSYMYK